MEGNHSKQGKNGDLFYEIAINIVITYHTSLIVFLHRILPSKSKPFLPNNDIPNLPNHFYPTITSSHCTHYIRIQYSTFSIFLCHYSFQLAWLKVNEISHQKMFCMVSFIFTTLFFVTTIIKKHLKNIFFDFILLPCFLLPQ